MVVVVVVVVAAAVCVCTAVGIGAGANSRCAGVVFLLLECAELKGASRPKDRPTADAPTTVAVAQSVGTVFILVRIQAAGESSLVEALVTRR